QMSSLNAGERASKYLKTRGEAEAQVRNSGMDWTIYRPSVVYGPGDGLVFRFLKLLQMSLVLPLAQPHAKFAPAYVGDVAQAIKRCLADRSRPSAGDRRRIDPRQTFFPRQLQFADAGFGGYPRWFRRSRHRAAPVR